MKLFFLFSLLFCLIQACTNAPPKHRTQADNDVDTSVKTDTGNSINELQIGLKDQSLIVDIFKNAMLETRMSKIMQSKAYHPPIKRFASLLYEERRIAEESLKALALQKQVTLPAALGPEMQNQVDTLSAAGGREIDYKYLNFMIKSHQEDLKNYELGITTLKDKDLKAYVLKMLPAIKKQLEDSNRLLDSLNKK